MGWPSTPSMLSEKWSIIADLHIRRNHFITHPGFYFIRIGGGYKINSNIAVGAGYANLLLGPSISGYKTFADENRIFEQIQLTAKARSVSILNRLRIEQRWQEKLSKDVSTHTNKFTNRVRYLLSFTIPLSKKSYMPSLVISDEVAIQFGKEVLYNRFDQNRAFLGFKQTLNKDLSFDIGYMLVFQQKSNGYQYDFNNTYRCFFYYTPTIRKKK